MYLTKIELTNFQSHKSTIINLDGGFVCIAGRTRSGKSSVLRALNFMFNDVWSDSFIRTGEKSVKVSVTLDNGIKVVREKGNGLNKITVINPDGTSKEFTNFGIQAPVEIKHILGVSPLVIDSDYSENINIHMQDDPHFLLTKSAPMKTKFINRLTQLHIVDAVNRELTKEMQDNKQSLEGLEKSIVELREVLKQYDNLESHKNFILQLQEKLNDLLKAFETINLKYVNLFKLATKMASYLKLKLFYEKREKLIKKTIALKGIVVDYNRINNILLLYAKRLYLNRLINLQENTLSVYNELLQYYKNYGIIQKLENLQQGIKNKELELKDQEEFIKLGKQVTKVCPTCKRPLWSKDE